MVLMRRMSRRLWQLRWRRRTLTRPSRQIPHKHLTLTRTQQIPHQPRTQTLKRSHQHSSLQGLPLRMTPIPARHLSLPLHQIPRQNPTLNPPLNPPPTQPLSPQQNHLRCPWQQHKP